MLTIAIIAALLLTPFCIKFAPDLFKRSATMGVPPPPSLASDLQSLITHIRENDYCWTELQGSRGSTWYQGEMELGFGRKYFITWYPATGRLELVDDLWFRLGIFSRNGFETETLSNLQPEIRATLTEEITARVTNRARVPEMSPEAEARLEEKLVRIAGL